MHSLDVWRCLVVGFLTVCILEQEGPRPGLLQGHLLTRPEQWFFQANGLHITADYCTG